MNVSEIFFFFQAEDGIRDGTVTGVQTCALPILARQALTSGWRVGLVANTHLSRGRGALRVPPSSTPGQEAALFAALARMPNEPTSDLAPVLRDVGRGLGRNATAAVIAPRAGPWLAQEIEVLRRRGVEVAVLSPVEARLAEAG